MYNVNYVAKKLDLDYLNANGTLEKYTDQLHEAESKAAKDGRVSYTAANPDNPYTGKITNILPPGQEALYENYKNAVSTNVQQNPNNNLYIYAAIALSVLIIVYVIKKL